MAWLAAAFLTLRVVSSLPPCLLSFARLAERRHCRHRNEHFSLFHLEMPQIVWDQKCRREERGEGGGPQVATNDSLTRIHRPRPPHHSRSPDGRTDGRRDGGQPSGMKPPRASWRPTGTTDNVTMVTDSPTRLPLEMSPSNATRCSRCRHTRCGVAGEWSIGDPDHPNDNSSLN